jgi:uncharacterized membrane protein
MERLAGGVELAAAMIIGPRCRGSRVECAAAIRPARHVEEAKVQVRLSLGRCLALGLEFALAADILRTAVAPSWPEIGQLAAIAVLRTGLNYGLEREIACEERRDITCAARASSD